MIRWCLTSTGIDEIESELKSLGLGNEGTRSEKVFKLMSQIMIDKKADNGFKMSLFSYNDRHGWGKEITHTMQKISGVECKLFKDPKIILNKSGTVVFMHPDHLNNRDSDKEIIRSFGSLRITTTIIPSIRELDIYDEKIKQTDLFGDWLPETNYFCDRKSAEVFLDECEFPIISKSNEGAGSSNVRMINSIEEAHDELERVFSGRGMPRYTKPSMEKRGKKNFQRGYVLWQDFLDGNENDWRVVMIGRRYAWIVKRLNRKDLPFASGSGIAQSITKLSAEVEELLEYSYSFADEFSLEFTGIDIIRGKNGQPKVLETTTGWPIKGSFGEMAFESTVFVRTENLGWEPTIFKGADLWKIASLAIIGKFSGEI
jgi:glutathione synthase/RimK-type ligase-like ATP-grasp enzyme